MSALDGRKKLYPVASAVSKNVAVLFGDSIAGQNHAQFTISSITAANGIATLVTSTAHGMSTGDVSVVANAAPAGFYGVKQFTRVDTTTLTYPCSETGTATLSSASLLNQARTSESGWLAWANSKAGNRIRKIINLGQSGCTTDDTLANLQFLENYAPDAGIVFVICGINDFIGGSARSSAYVCANLKTIFDTIRERGRTLVALGVTPLGTGHASYGATVQTKILETNKFCAWYCQKFNNAYFANAFAEITDSTQALGGGIAARLKTDGIHLSALGARLIGENRLYPILNQIVPPIDTLATSQGDTANLAPNPMMTGTGGSVSGTGVSGTVPTSWRVRLTAGALTGTAVASIASRADGVGSDIVVTITNANSGAEISVDTPSSFTGSTFGDTVEAEASISMTGMSNVSKMRFYLSYAIDGNTYEIESLASAPSTFSQTDWSNPVITPRFKIPPGTSITIATLTCRVAFGAASGACVLKFGRPRIEVISNSPLGLA